MFDFLRLLLEANMSTDKAVAIFKKFGATNDDLSSPESIKAFRKKVLLKGKMHTDLGGNNEDAALINSAYDTIKNGISMETSSDDPYANYNRDDREPTPIWAMAGHSGGAPPNSNIYKQNYTDLNYIKKSMNYMSKEYKDQQVYTVWAFDGHFFRGVFSTYAAPEIFQELAQAMITWNSHGGNPYATRAVFVQQKRNPELYLIYADKKYYSNPVPFEHESMNMNPGNDQHFQRRLPDMLDRLRDGT